MNKAVGDVSRQCLAAGPSLQLRIREKSPSTGHADDMHYYAQG